MKTFFAFLFFIVISGQLLYAQAPDKAQVERLKKMAEGMKGLSPQQIQARMDSVMGLVKKIQKTKDSIQDGIEKGVEKKMPRSKAVFDYARQKSDTAYTSVRFNYSYTLSAPPFKIKRNAAGASSNVPIITKGQNKFVQVYSSGVAGRMLMDGLLAARAVSPKFAAASTSLQGAAGYNKTASEDGYVYTETGSQLNDTAGMAFSFVLDSLEGIAALGAGGTVNTKGREKLPQHEEYRDFIGRVSAGTGVTSDPKKATLADGSSFPVDPAKPAAIFSRSPEGYTITYSYSDTRSEGGKTITETEMLTAFIGIPQQQWEAIIKPVEAGRFQYKRWLPGGPKTDGSDDTKGDDSLQFFVVVRDKTDPTKIYHGNYTVNWELADVTHYPGICNNYPQYSDAPDVTADIKFDSLMVNDPAFDGDAISDSTARTAEGKGSDAFVHLICMDYAAFGKLKATVIMKDGTVLKALSPDTKQSFVTIPFDNNNNKIADAWEKAEGVFEKNYALTWDEDDLPKDLGDKHNGDGYTLLEEYRGFSENLKHFRSSAQTKDLMVCDMIGERSKDGIALFKDVTGIKVHDDFKLEEFGRPTDDILHEGMPRDKCLNFNFTPGTHSVDQHGIAMVKSLERKGYAQAVAKPTSDTTDLPIGTPKNYKYLEITLDFDPGPNGFNVVNGTIKNAGAISASFDGKAKIISDNYAHTVAHEMLHCCHVKHHGDIDFGKCTLIAGVNVPADAALAEGLVIEPEKIYVMVGNTVYTIWGHGGATLESRVHVLRYYEVPKRGLLINVAVQHGQHSGNEDCIMRYRSANAYINKWGELYLLDAPAGYSAELAGIKLCTTKAGTGENAADHKPIPRYGDATEGACKHQFCINDKYHLEKK